jgi:RNA polymerase sigma-70 factor (ECF subfamily)
MGHDDPLVGAARQGDEAAFERLVARYRPELAAHCYRMLGSIQDAEDAVQEALLGAWRGLPGFDARSSFRTWLYAVTTNACLRAASRRPRRVLSFDRRPAWTDTADLGGWVGEPVWLEPRPDDPVADDGSDPESAYLRRESVELAYVAALQHLPGAQRAVLILRDALGFSAAETAEILGTTPASVNSAMQRARTTVAERIPTRSQHDELTSLGPEGCRGVLEAFVTAWERSDVAALLELMAEDARFTMPPLPAWFDGREAVGRFMAERMFAAPWRLLPLRANGQPGFACYQHDGHGYALGAINVLSFRSGRVAWIAAFLDPEVHRRFGIPEIFPSDR